MGREPRDLARIRDNQRRCRARRREYLARLEQKLRDYEKQGLQATQEMQRAAREVAAENAALRELLTRCGVAPIEVERHLRFSRDVSAPPTLIVDDAPEALPCEAMSLTEAAEGLEADAVSACLTGGLTKLEESPPQLTATPARPRLPPLKEAMAMPVDNKLSVLADASNLHPPLADLESICPTARPGLSASSSTSPSESSASLASTDTEMSCSDAARIIADMQGHSNYELPKPSLGCREAQECRVKTHRVFQVLDNS